MSCYVYDTELEAMHAVLRTVERLSDEERTRVFEWVSNRVGFLAEQAREAEDVITRVPEPALAEVAE